VLTRLHHRTMLCVARRSRVGGGAPRGIRIPATALKGRRPRPLDDGGSAPPRALHRSSRTREKVPSLVRRSPGGATSFGAVRHCAGDVRRKRVELLAEDDTKTLQAVGTSIARVAKRHQGAFE
jgi:hypothetical protein